MKKLFLLAPLVLFAVPLAAEPVSAQTVVFKAGPGPYRGGYGRGVYRAPVAQRYGARRGYGPGQGRTVTRTTTRTNRMGTTTTRSVTRSTY